jgi:hypothetical protein
MVVASPPKISLPLLSALCVLCVKIHFQPDPAVSVHLACKSRTICTYEKRAPNPFRMRSFKKLDLKPFRMNIYRKTGVGGVLLLTRNAA